MQARHALRSFREAHAASATSIVAQQEQPEDSQLNSGSGSSALTCCRIQLPIPHPGDEDAVQLLDSSKFPGGIRQLTRQMAPLVDDLMYGCVPLLCSSCGRRWLAGGEVRLICAYQRVCSGRGTLAFSICCALLKHSMVYMVMLHGIFTCRHEVTEHGALGHKGDGICIWRTSHMTAVLNVGTATFQTFLEAFEELEAQGCPHTVVAVNGTWSAPADVGQLWQRCASSI